MKYCWGIAVVLSSGIVAGCSGGTAATDDAGSDAFVARDSGPTNDAQLDAFRAIDAGEEDPPSLDMGVDTFPTDANVTDTGIDAGHDGGHDAALDGGHDAASTRPDGGCLAIEGEMGHDCNPSATPAYVCSAGFTCQATPGIIAQYQCEILCDGPGAACPCGTNCTQHSQESLTWNQCDQL